MKLWFHYSHTSEFHAQLYMLGAAWELGNSQWYYGILRQMEQKTYERVVRAL